VSAAKDELAALLKEKTKGEIGTHLLSLDPKEWVDRAASLVGDRGEGWLDEVLDAASDMVDTEEDAGVAKAAADAIEVLKENKQPFLRLGNVGFAWVAANFDDDMEEAKRAYMATRATYAERRAFKHALTDRLVDWTAEASAAWEAVVAVLRKIGDVALAFLTRAALVAIA
jgi:hypothetical protein